MKSNYTLLAIVMMMCSTVTMLAQDIEFPGLDKSPMDAAHYPRRSAYANYLDADDADRTQKIKVLYSRPQKNGREIFGALVPYGKTWRLGANEAQEVTFYQAVEIGNTYVAPGTYTMFAEINEDHWIFKLSKERFIAGVDGRDESMDVVSTKIMVEKVNDVKEAWSIGFQKIDEGMVHMLFQWDQTRAALPINLNPPMFDGDDASPMDLVAYPTNSRFLNFQKAEDRDKFAPKVRVVYSRPQLKGRKVFGEMLKYGEMWRVGANQTTEVTFFEDVMIGGKKINKGKYGLFATINKDNWEFVLHTNVQSWGNANHDPETNVVSVVAPVVKTPSTLEALSMVFEEKGNNKVDLIVGWENAMARLPIEILK